MAYRAVLAVLLAAALFLGTPRAGAAPVTEGPDPQLKKLYKERLEAAKEACEAMAEEMKAGKRVPDEEYARWSRRWAEAEVALLEKKEDKAAVYGTHLDRMKEFEKLAKAQFDAGRCTVVHYNTAKYCRIEAEILLAQAKGK